MKCFRYYIVATILLTASFTYGQTSWDLGGAAGISSYWGDLEQVGPFDSFSPTLGGFIRYNFDKRLSVKAGAYYGQHTGSQVLDGYIIAQPEGKTDNETLDGESYYRADPTNNYNFRRNYLTIETMFEFNFLNYQIGNKKANWTPYLTVGLGYHISGKPNRGSLLLDPTSESANEGFYLPALVDETNINQTNERSAHSLVIPFGVGVKYSLNQRFEIGSEIITRKTFTDNLDNLDSPLRFVNKVNQSDQSTDPIGQGTYHNNDWFASITVTLCYKIFMKGRHCPVFD